MDKVLKFHHNSTLGDKESSWGRVVKTKLPRSAFAEQGDPEKKSTWKYPHHWVSGGEVGSDDIFTSGTLYLHKGGLSAAWAAAGGARSGQQASSKIKSHLQTHRKALGIKEDNSVYLAFKSENDEAQVVYSEVYAPYHIDTDKETMTQEDVQQMAWDFLSSGKIEKIDVRHHMEESGCIVVESFIAGKDWEPFIEGAWVLGVQCPDDVWEEVKKGELNGFSFAGVTDKYPAKVLVEVAKQITGITESSTVESIPTHEHTFIINLDNKGKIVSGGTDYVQEHFHTIKAGTITSPELNHSHRIVLE